MFKAQIRDNLIIAFFLVVLFKELSTVIKLIEGLSTSAWYFPL
jgi:hypothetical protein